MGGSETRDNDWDKALKEFQNVIAIGTKSMKIIAMITLSRASKHAHEPVLSRCIPLLIGILNHNGPDDFTTSLQKAAAYCLKCIAYRSDDLIIQRVRGDVARSLMSLLPNSDGKYMEILVKCLMVVLNFCNESRDVVANNDGVKIIVNLLSSCEDGDIRQYLLEILILLMLQSDKVKKEIAKLDAYHFIVEAIGVGSMVSRERACQAIGMIESKIDRQALINLGVISGITELFRVGDHATKLIVGNTLGVISTNVVCLRSVGLAVAIPLYVELLQGHDPFGRNIAKDALCVMSIAEANVVEILGHLMRNLREGHDEAKAAAANVVSELSSYLHLRPVVWDSGVILILVELLGSGSVLVKENVIAAFGKVSYKNENRAVISDAGVIPILCDLLHAEFEKLRENATEAFVQFYEDPLYRDSLSDQVVNAPSFRSMQNRLANDPIHN